VDGIEGHPHILPRGLQGGEAVRFDSALVSTQSVLGFQATVSRSAT
jgi:hypothetical protein